MFRTVRTTLIVLVLVILASLVTPRPAVAQQFPGGAYACAYIEQAATEIGASFYVTGFVWYNASLGFTLWSYEVYFLGEVFYGQCIA